MKRPLLLFLTTFFVLSSSGAEAIEFDLPGGYTLLCWTSGFANCSAGCGDDLDECRNDIDIEDYPDAAAAYTECIFGCGLNPSCSRGCVADLYAAIPEYQQCERDFVDCGVQCVDSHCRIVPDSLDRNPVVIR